MRAAIFTSQFPGRVNTFFARDVRALIDAGIDVDVFPLYPLDERHWDAVPDCLGPRVLPRNRVHHLRPSAWWIRDALARPGWLATVAAEGVRIAGSAVTFGSKPLMKSAYAIAMGHAWACRHSKPFDAVLAYWGNYAATAAYVFHRLTCGQAPFSMFLHAGTDLYRDQVFLRAKLREATSVILVCEFNRLFLFNLYPDLRGLLESKIHIHHLPLDLEEFAWSTAARAPKQLLSVGALEPQKGQAVVLRAAAALDAQGHHDLAVRFIGDGSCRQDLEQQASSLGLAGRVSFDGWVTPAEARRAIEAATILVHASTGLGDAVPTVIKEALAVGTPVVASDVAGIPELLDDGRCGTLVPPGDASALAAGVARLLDDASFRCGLARAGREHAERAFDVRRNGPRLAAIISRTPQAPIPDQTVLSRGGVAAAGKHVR